MRRYLVVANQTLHRAERDELRKRAGAGPSSFHLVPGTTADYLDMPAAAAGVLQPAMTW